MPLAEDTEEYHSLLLALTPIKKLALPMWMVKPQLLLAASELFFLTHLNTKQLRLNIKPPIRLRKDH